MADEDDLHIVVLCTQEAHHPEVEAAGDVLFKFAHRARPSWRTTMLKTSFLCSMVCQFELPGYVGML